MSHRLTLQLTVDYDLHGVDPADMAANLQRLVERAIGEGLLTGETEAEVDTWVARVLDDTELGDVGDVNSPDAIGAWLRSLDKESYVYIDDDGMRLRVVDHEAYIEIGGHTPEQERLPLSKETFVDYLETNCEAIKPEEAFREVCLLQDSEEWRRMENKRCAQDPYYEIKCRLELDDHPGFRQGLNDHADSMVKDRQWVTFDNGDTYYTADQIKEVVQFFDESEWEYEPSLRDKVDHWL